MWQRAKKCDALEMMSLDKCGDIGAKCAAGIGALAWRVAGVACACGVWLVCFVRLVGVVVCVCGVCGVLRGRVFGFRVGF